jgi:phosphopantothenoylcysteine decarboxylase/phosphopantothenate--cysteine ligase
MNEKMWLNKQTQKNLQTLRENGVRILEPKTDILACGEYGVGKMVEPTEIFLALQNFFNNQQIFTNKKIIITAGATFEPIDPVRFIGNRSSGKLGIALADAAARRGAEVTLVLGPSKLTPQDKAVKLIKVETAQEMHSVALQLFPQMDAAILAAAVADYRPKTVATEKIKKKGEELQLDLIKNPDIAADLGKMKQATQLLIGFALETNDEETNAQGKLEKKNFDCIVLNSLRDSGAGFNHDTNKISILFRNNNKRDFELKSKNAVAEDILQAMIDLFKG